MSTKVERKCCAETEQEKLDQISKVIEEYKDKEGSLIQVLHYAQGIYGYLPTHVQELISNKLNIPLTEVYGVVTFYSFFSMYPKGEYTIRVCLGTACYVRGGKNVLDKIKEVLKIDVGQTTEDRKFSLEVMRCIGACGLAPAITINDKVYKQVSPAKIPSIIEEY